MTPEEIAWLRYRAGTGPFDLAPSEVERAVAIKRAAQDAVAAERARIAEAVRGLPTSEASWGSVPVVTLAAVLEIIEGETP